MENSRLPTCKPIRSSEDPEILELAFSLQHQELALIKIKYSSQFISMIHNRADETDLKEYSFGLDLPMTDPDFPFDVPNVHFLIIWPLNYPSFNSLVYPKILLRDKQIPNSLSIKIQHYLDKYITTCITQQNATLFLLTKIQQGLLEQWTLAADPYSQSSSLKFIPAHKIQIQSNPSILSQDSTLTDFTKHLSIHDSDSSKSEDESGMSNINLHTQYSRSLTHGTAVYFKAVSLTKIALVEPLVLKLQLVCNRCKSVFTTSLISPLPERNASHICSNCKTSMDAILFQPKHFFPSCTTEVAIIQSSKAQIVDILLSEYRLTCESCNSNTITVQLTKGQTKYLTCNNCNSSLGISIQHIELRSLNQTSSDTLSKKKKPTDKFALALGKSLPEYGTCKHYKKSYRWLRFPCCGAAYPCDQCHDLAVEKNKDSHIIQWATRMICGFCSKEQPFSQTNPCSCGKTLSTVGQKKTAFWEGGKGSRDATTMSRKDSKKYRLMKKS